MYTYIYILHIYIYTLSVNVKRYIYIDKNIDMPLISSIYSAHKI